ncbi:O-antigen ligase family protein [Thermaerobacter sp. PB12/4term]|nr:O-antigen ligase family protein [Thermaerobacter sp. PB12/4term]QIA26702.1 O-antigen ligase family protein [Thermaerobacter sp. PB12/4term]
MTVQVDRVSPRRQIGNRMVVLAAALVFAALHVYGVGVLRLYGFNIAPWDLSFFVILLLWLFCLARVRYVRLNAHVLVGLFFATLFTIWIGIEALRSPMPDRGFTLFLQQLRNVGIFLVVATLMSHEALLQLNRVVFRVGFVIAAVALILFGNAMVHRTVILATPSLWRPEPQIGYLVDQGGVIRLIGLARDPNFYSLWMAPLLLAGLTLRQSPEKWVGSLFMGLSIVFAMSRTFILVFVISTIFLFFCTWKVSGRGGLRPYFSAILSSLIVICISGSLLARFADISVWDVIRRRYQLIFEAPRWIVWERLLAYLPDNVLFGIGSRGVQVALGGMYSHNSYLDLIIETGVVGFAIWAALTLVVTVDAIRVASYALAIPWVHAWFIMLGMFFAFSLVYNPFYWIIAGIILSLATNCDRE